MLLIQQHLGLTMSRLAELSFMEKTMVSKAVTRLTKSGLVERQIGETDARQVSLVLTRKGKRVAETAAANASNWIKGLVSVLTKHERDVFDTVLDKLTVKLLADRKAMWAVEHEKAAAKLVKRPARGE